MNIPSSLAIVAFAALIHASFQLSVSVLVILSSHTLGARHSQAKLLRLTTSFVIGAGIMTILLLSFVSLFVLSLLGNNIPPLVWSIACGMLVGMAISVWVFYYRREKGTTLWIPRGMAEYLIERTKSTRLSAEAFGLGLSSVFGELLFIVAPLTIAALALVRLPSIWQLTGVAVYATISLLSLLIVWVLISSGHKLSSIQKWRESNKYFLQFAAGSGLIILSVFVYTSQVLGNIVGGV